MNKDEILKKVPDFDMLLGGLHEGAYCTDAERKIVYWNNAAEKISGFKKTEVVGCMCFDNILQHIDEAGQSLCLTSCPLLKTMEDRTGREATIYLHHKDGHRVPVHVRTSALINEEKEVIGGLEVFTDSSHNDFLKGQVEHLKKMAFFDQLTQIPNRNYVLDFVQQKFKALDNSKLPFGLLLFDVDHFKKINDEHGHGIGDDILKMVAKTISLNIRSFDMVARWGGEEFIGIMSNVDQNTLLQNAERIRALVAESYLTVKGENLSATVSVGGSLAISGDSLQTLFNRADSYLYKSKSGGRNRVTLHETNSP